MAEACHLFSRDKELSNTLNTYTCLFASLLIKLFSCLRISPSSWMNSAIHESSNSLAKEFAHTAPEVALPELFPVALLCYCLSASLGDWLLRTSFQSSPSTREFGETHAFKSYASLWISDRRFKWAFQKSGILKANLG